MVRLIDGQPPGGAATNRAYQEFGTKHALSNRCIGSDCMMWRWEYLGVKTIDGKECIEWVKEHRNATGCALKDAKDEWDKRAAAASVQGYCGLASRL